MVYYNKGVKLFLLLVISFLFRIGNAPAQNYISVGPYGLSALKGYYLNDDSIFCLSFRNNIYMSNDRGLSWSLLRRVEDAKQWVNICSRGVLAVQNSTLFKADFESGGWLIDRTFADSILTLDVCFNDRTAYGVLTKSSIFTTKNNGGTWSGIDISMYKNPYMIRFGEIDTILFQTMDSLYLITNNGSRITGIASNSDFMNPVYFQHGMLIKDTRYGLSASTDLSRSWYTWYTKLQMDDDVGFCTSHDTVYVVDKRHFEMSTNNGKTWQQGGNFDYAPAYLTEVIALKNGDIIAFDWLGIYKMRNGESILERTCKGIPEVDASDFAITDSTYFVCGNGEETQIYNRADRSWSISMDPSIRETQGHCVCTSFQDTLYAVADSRRFIRSADYGRTWVGYYWGGIDSIPFLIDCDELIGPDRHGYLYVFNRGKFGVFSLRDDFYGSDNLCPDIVANAACIRDSLIVLGAARMNNQHEQLRTSTDWGKTWINNSVNKELGTIASIQMRGDSVYVLSDSKSDSRNFGCFNGFVIKPLRGTTYHTVELPDTLNCLRMTENGVLYIGAANGALYSYDTKSGVLFKIIDEPGLVVKKMLEKDPTHLLLLTNYGILEVAMLLTDVEKVDSTMATVELYAYPNPSHGNIIVRVADVDQLNANCILRLYNNNGELVWEHRVDRSEGKYSSVFKTNSLAKGMYHLELTSGQKQTVRNLIIN